MKCVQPIEPIDSVEKFGGKPANRLDMFAVCVRI
jgi:hypothetical protein